MGAVVVEEILLNQLEHEGAEILGGNERGDLATLESLFREGGVDLLDLVPDGVVLGEVDDHGVGLFGGQLQEAVELVQIAVLAVGVALPHGLLHLRVDGLDDALDDELLEGELILGGADLHEVFGVLAQELVRADSHVDLDEAGSDFTLGQFDAAFLGVEAAASAVLERGIDVEIVDGRLRLDAGLGHHVADGVASENDHTDELVAVLLDVLGQGGDDDVEIFRHGIRVLIVENQTISRSGSGTGGRSP